MTQDAQKRCVEALRRITRQDDGYIDPSMLADDIATLRALADAIERGQEAEIHDDGFWRTLGNEPPECKIDWRPVLVIELPDEA